MKELSFKQKGVQKIDHSTLTSEPNMLTWKIAERTFFWPTSKGMRRELGGFATFFSSSFPFVSQWWNDAMKEDSFSV